MNHIKDYIKLLQESLKKKLEIIEELQSITKEQSAILTNKDLDMDAFEGTMNKKDGLIKKVTLIDDGFNGIYDRVRTEIKEHTHLYKEEVSLMKELITQISNITVEIQIMEQANKNLLDSHYKRVNTKVRRFNKGSRQSLAYYKNATSGVMENSYLMDERN